MMKQGAVTFQTHIQGQASVEKVNRLDQRYSTISIKKPLFESWSSEPCTDALSPYHLYFYYVLKDQSQGECQEKNNVTSMVYLLGAIVTAPSNYYFC